MASANSASSAFSTGFQLLSAVLLLWLLLLSQIDCLDRRDEVRTLLSFKQANFPALNDYTGDAIVYWTTWHESDETPCAWVGVTCTDNDTVWELDFSGWGFNEMAVQLLANLTDLRQLDLSSNNLLGIPEDIGNLTGLTLLNVSGNNIYGDIPPSISACRSLRSLDLQDNNLQGEIPSLRGMANLQYLVLADNQFSGQFPKELEELSTLLTLDLSDNSFNGTVPALPNLSHILELKLDNNRFTQFEKDLLLGANSSLQRLSASFNQLEGMIPSSVPQLLNLRILNLAGNRLSGGIPYGMPRVMNDKNFQLDLSLNQLTGEIPADFLQESNLSCYSSINLSYNLLFGSIPPIGRANNLCLVYFDLSNNNLSGPIPWNMLGHEGNVVYYLYLYNNQLSGDIVDIIVESASFSSVTGLEVQNNLFTGDLSRIANSNISQFYNLRELDLSNNDLQWSASKAIPDPIQATLERISNGAEYFGLTEFRARGNNFSRTSLPKTCFVNDSNTDNSSALLSTLQILDLSDNQLNGEITSAAFDSSCLPALWFLNLSNNDITGSVPESIITISSLEILDVSNNHLSGPLPNLLSNSILNNRSWFDGNSALCGFPLETCPVKGSSHLQWWELLLIIAGSVSIAAALSCLVVTRWQRRVYRKKHQQDVDLIRTLMERESATLMSLRDLRKATDNFAKSAQIGQGGFGTVYIGKLNDGTTVAIKRSKREGSEKDKQQFLNEVRILSQVNHRNLVKLLGCCMENKIAVLVFEFVSNGTLQEHLQGKIGAVCLTWKQRLNIAVQTADALNYLHTAATFPIYHRDVKSANILLNDDLNAKVADFGISRLAPLQATHISTAVIQGTMGYIDPEYYTSYQLTDKSDVYSFGVVLLELISAKPALDFRRGGEDTSLVNFAGPYIVRGNLEGFIDPALMETYSDSAGHGRESILNVGRLAMACVDIRSKARPSMNEVMIELQSLWLNLYGTSRNLDSIKEDDDKVVQRDQTVLSEHSFSGASSSFTVDRPRDAFGIEMSQLSRLLSRTASM